MDRKSAVIEACPANAVRPGLALAQRLNWRRELCSFLPAMQCPIATLPNHTALACLVATVTRLRVFSLALSLSLNGRFRTLQGSKRFRGAFKMCLYPSVYSSDVASARSHNNFSCRPAQIRNLAISDSTIKQLCASECPILYSLQCPSDFNYCKARGSREYRRSRVGVFVIRFGQLGGSTPCRKVPHNQSGSFENTRSPSPRAGTRTI